MEWLIESSYPNDETLVVLDNSRTFAQLVMAEAMCFLSRDAWVNLQKFAEDNNGAVIAGSFSAACVRNVILKEIEKEKTSHMTTDNDNSKTQRSLLDKGLLPFGDVDVWSVRTNCRACEWNSEYPFGYVQDEHVVDGIPIQYIVIASDDEHSTHSENWISQKVIEQFDIQPPKIAIQLLSGHVTLTRGAIWCALHGAIHVPIDFKYLVEHWVSPLLPFDKPSNVHLPDLKVCYTTLPPHAPNIDGSSLCIPNEIIEHISTFYPKKVVHTVKFSDYLQIAIAQENETGNRNNALLRWWMISCNEGARLYNGDEFESELTSSCFMDNREQWLIQIINRVTGLTFEDNDPDNRNQRPIVTPNKQLTPLEWNDLKREIEMWHNYGVPPDPCVTDRNNTLASSSCHIPSPPEWRRDVSDYIINIGDFVRKHDVNNITTVIENTIGISTTRHLSKRLLDRLHKYMRRGYDWIYTQQVTVIDMPPGIQAPDNSLNRPLNRTNERQSISDLSFVAF